MSVSDGDLGLIRFIQFRKRYLKAIERALEKDDHHKSYEGQMLVEVYWPDYFHDNEMLPSEVVLKIDCYVLGIVFVEFFKGEQSSVFTIRE